MIKKILCFIGVHTKHKVTRSGVVNSVMFTVNTTECKYCNKLIEMH